MSFKSRDVLPIATGLVLIVFLTIAEGYWIKDRWGDPTVDSNEFGKRFSQVPMTIGPWKGEDLPVDEVVKKTAGAVSYVSRRYTNAQTGRKVTLWLIVGHSRDIIRHTPNICYPSSGFTQQGSQLRHHVDIGDKTEATFYTARFQKEDAFGRLLERVFWAWNHPDTNRWEAPDSARFHYGRSRALYKVYFTSDVLTTEKTIDDNPAADFAQLMLPAIDAALFPTEDAEASANTAAESS